MMYFILFFNFLLVFADVPQGGISETVTENDKKMLEMLKLTQNDKIDFQEFPNKRSLSYVTRGLLDFHFPVLRPLNNVKRTFDYSFSDVTVLSVTYAVFINKKNKKIGVHNLQDFLIEGENGHVDFFDFNVIPSTCVECSLKKVDSGRIDGYIYPAVKGDELIKSLNLRNIESYYFDTYEVKFALPLNAKGEKMNQLLNSLFFKLKSKGSLKQIYRNSILKNENWKPTLENSY